MIIDTLEQRTHQLVSLEQLQVILGLPLVNNITCVLSMILLNLLFIEMFEKYFYCILLFPVIVIVSRLTEDIINAVSTAKKSLLPFTFNIST